MVTFIAMTFTEFKKYIITVYMKLNDESRNMIY